MLKRRKECRVRGVAIAAVLRDCLLPDTSSDSIIGFDWQKKVQGDALVKETVICAGV